MYEFLLWNFITHCNLESSVFVALYVTDIIQNGSYVIFNTKGQEVVDVVYQKEKIPEGYFVENCVSRKKHVVPLIMEVFEN